jgi:hypothetical protein
LGPIVNRYSNFPPTPTKSSSTPKKAVALAPLANDDQDSGQQDIENDPQAMKCIADLVNAGYTSDQVVQAMDDLSGSDDQGNDDDDDYSDDDQSGGQSAPLPIPGMR